MCRSRRRRRCLRLIKSILKSSRARRQTQLHIRTPSGTTIASSTDPLYHPRPSTLDSRLSTLHHQHTIFPRTTHHPPSPTPPPRYRGVSGQEKALHATHRTVHTLHVHAPTSTSSLVQAQHPGRYVQTLALRPSVTHTPSLDRALVRARASILSLSVFNLPTPDTLPLTRVSFLGNLCRLARATDPCQRPALSTPVNLASETSVEATLRGFHLNHAYRCRSTLWMALVLISGLTSYLCLTDPVTTLDLVSR